ncbi:unnamed protein product [Prunus armeniaca]|uniref:C2 domain-containing protein n=1 Tax=Prunus armeniaca TaxID=36596 RepID=A0A6J5U9Q7_PRUAR|nr:unnamed protein product [Prunus armeniaca]
MSNLKLGVLVVSAHDLIVPKDGRGAASAFVELHFDNQTFQTVTKERDANPVWDQSFYFNISDPKRLPNLTLEAHVYHFKEDSSKSFLGKVCLPVRSLSVPYSLQHHPLRKKGILFNSRVKGELGLKVFVIDGDGHDLPMNSGMHDEIESQQPQPEPESKPESSKDDDLSSSSDYLLKETNPYLGRGQIVQGRLVPGDVSTYDLVETMHYLFVLIVKARLDFALNSEDVAGSLKTYLEIKVGNCNAITKHVERKQNPEWNEVFAFAKDYNLEPSALDVVVKDDDQFFGSLHFDLKEFTTRVPPDKPGAPKWYQIEDKDVEIKKKGELKLAVWHGTQADVAFPYAWHSDASLPPHVSSDADAHIRAKVYHSPRLWYIRVKVIEAHDLVASDKSRVPEAYAQVMIGNQCLKTKIFSQPRKEETETAQSPILNPVWNEDLMFVAAQPFGDDQHLMVSVEDRVSPDKDETLGKVAIALNSIEKPTDDQSISSQWFTLETSIMSDSMKGKQQSKDKDEKLSSRIHLHVCLEGGYHALDEPTNYSSDLQPAATQIWKPCIGVIELGVLNASELLPMKTREGKDTSDTYCVAKYGHKWVRTRTITDSLSPKFNEQHTWDVYDLHTVLTVGVFDNSRVGNHANGNKDEKFGKVQIRISTLESGRVYTFSYPLISLRPSGVKKTGELHLAVRFSCTSLVNMMFLYSQPLLTGMQQDMLYDQAVLMVADSLGLEKEVVQYTSSNAEGSDVWSVRRSKANVFRLMSVFSGLVGVAQWFGEVRVWKNPLTTALVHVLFVMIISSPQLILPTVFLYMFVTGIWNFQYRPRYPAHMDTKLSQADSVLPDELDEELHTLPTSTLDLPDDIVRMRYDRLRSIAGRFQNMMGDVATELERIQEILRWPDSHAKAMFAIFCLVAAVVFYFTPFQVVVLVAGFYYMRHPKYRSKMPVPSALVNFFQRLPAKTDYML